MEESGKVESLKIEELQGSLEAHEQRLNERTTKRNTDQALQAQTYGRGGSSGRSYKKTRGRGRDPRSNARKAPQQQEPEKHDSEQPELSNGRGGYRQYRGGKKRFDRKRLKCFNCGKIGHFFAECQAPTQNQSKGRQDSEANLAKGKDADVEDNTLLLMMTTYTEVGNDDT